MITDMSFSEVKLFADIVANLENMRGDTEVRQAVLSDIATLLRAEYGCSYIWNRDKNEFDSCFNHNLSPESEKRYREWFQFHDPITFRMRDKRCSIASEVMPYKEFYRTEYYNEHMKKEGLRYGINLYIVEKDRDVGDFRIWRGSSGSNFEERDKKILSLLEPYLRKSILRQQEQSLDAHGLTPREKEIAQLVSKGLTDREIAGVLGIGFSTVRTHLNKSLDKLDCANRAELAARYGRQLSKTA